MRKRPAAFEVSENFTMSTVRGKAMKAAFSPWPPLGLLQAQLADALASSGCAAELPAKIKRICIEVRYTDHSAFELADCYFEDLKESIYRPCIHLDGRRLHEGMPDEERYWTLWRLGLDALIHVADRFSLPGAIRAPLVEARRCAVTGAPWPAIPAAPDADAAAGLEGETAHRPEQLPHEPGELWIHVHGDDSDSIIRALCDVMVAHGWGHWSGDSHGSGSSDASFEVEDMNQAELRISSYLRREWPDARFLVSDRYEPGDVAG